MYFCWKQKEDIPKNILFFEHDLSERIVELFYSETTSNGISTDTSLCNLTVAL